MKLIGVRSVVFPWFLILAAIIGYFYRLLAIGYLSTVGQGDWDRDLACGGALCSARGPGVVAGEPLEGIITVGAFSAERRFLDDLHLKIDVTTKVGFSLSTLHVVDTSIRRYGTTFG